MSTDETYNGWTNRETWAVALHINNDQGWQEGVHEALRADAELGCARCDREKAVHDADYAYPIGHAYVLRTWRAGEVIRENVEGVLFGDYGDGSDEGYALSQQQMGAIQDIGSLWRVNWDELGASFLTDIADQA